MEKSFAPLLKEIYSQALTPTEYKSRKEEDKLVRQAIRNWAVFELKMTPREVAKIELELYGGKPHRTTITHANSEHQNYKELPLYKLMYRALMSKLE